MQRHEDVEYRINLNQHTGSGIFGAAAGGLQDPSKSKNLCPFLQKYASTS